MKKENPFFPRQFSSNMALSQKASLALAKLSQDESKTFPRHNFQVLQKSQEQ
jgi:hypothetical protein